MFLPLFSAYKVYYIIQVFFRIYLFQVTPEIGNCQIWLLSCLPRYFSVVLISLKVSKDLWWWNQAGHQLCLWNGCFFLTKKTLRLFNLLEYAGRAAITYFSYLNDLRNQVMIQEMIIMWVSYSRCCVTSVLKAEFFWVFFVVVVVLFCSSGKRNKNNF